VSLEFALLDQQSDEQEVKLNNEMGESVVGWNK
jgi:hypothetical protein